jgi:Insertion element 4 transposase N-terminal
VVVGGVFAPGHLGELTRIIPFEMAGAVLASCGAVQRRVPKLPGSVVVYLLLASRCSSRPATRGQGQRGRPGASHHTDWRLAPWHGGQGSSPRSA